MKKREEVVEVVEVVESPVASVEDVKKSVKKEVSLGAIFQSVFQPLQRLHKERLKMEYQPESFSLWAFDHFKITDKQGNHLALYKNDYKIFINYLKKTHGHADIQKLKLSQFLDAIAESKVQVIKYLSPINLRDLRLDIQSFNKSGDFVTVSKLPALKKGHQNCVVMLDHGSIYMAPKIRATVGDIRSLAKSGAEDLKAEASKDKPTAVMGVNHSSLSNGEMVPFAGSFVHDEKHGGWVVENTTGHYGTRVTQMRNFLQALQKQGMNLESLSVKLWVPRDPKNPGVAEKDYEIVIEKAEYFLARINKSMSAISFGR